MLRRIAENYAAVKAMIADACREAGRHPDGVRIVGVTKYAGIDAAMAVFEAGCRDLAESRPQELWRKAEAFQAAGLQPRWHLIGHLQRNKVRRTLPLVHLFHSLDSVRLLRAIDEEARAAGRVAELLVEANLDGGAGRTGAAIADVPSLVAEAAGCAGVRVRGLMGMASQPEEGGDAAAAARRQFATLRELRDSLRTTTGEESLEELSMGMSGDFREAILEGATIVRIGSALFEGTAPAEDGPHPRT